MSHEIETTAWINTVPWHGLGVKMDPDATPNEWMRAAGLDWLVERVPMEATLPSGERVIVKGKSENDFGVLVRTFKNNTYDVFGPVGPEWVPVQNYTVFEFLKRFCDAGSMTMETCGALKNGTEVWALCKFAENFEPIKGDKFTGYLLFHSCHVWGKGNQLRVTPIRVVCNNTLTMALQGTEDNKVRLTHRVEFTANVQDTAIEALGLADQQLKQFAEKARVLSNRHYTADTLEEFVATLYCPKALDVSSGLTVQEQFTPTADDVYEAISLAPGADLKGSKGTWWGAFNGVTYHEDHMRISYKDDTNVLGSTWFGSGAKKKEKALELALEYAS